MKRFFLFLLFLSIAAAGMPALKFKVENYDMATARKVIDSRIADGTFELIEGIWRDNKGAVYAIERFVDARLPEEFRYRAIRLDGKEAGMVKYFFEMTTIDGVYHAMGENPFDRTYDEKYIIMTGNAFVFSPYSSLNKTFYRIYPLLDFSEKEEEVHGGAGSGFALTEGGYIATCAHVVRGYQQFLITGVNNDFTRYYNARVVDSDARIDVAILKIEDSTFTSFGKIPYSIRENNPVDGEFCFAIGYPEIENLGYSPKITTGIVSTSYDSNYPHRFQMTVPIESGNSGGAVFDADGNILGMAFAQYTDFYTSLSVQTTDLRNFIYNCSELQNLKMTPAPKGREMTKIVEANKPFSVLIFTDFDPRAPQANRTAYRFKKIEPSPSEKAQELFLSGKYSEAIEAASEALNQNAKNWWAYYLRGNCSKEMQNYPNAVIDYRQAILYCPDTKKDFLAEVHKQKAIAEIYMERYEDALADIDDALKFNEEDHSQLIFKGFILYCLGRYDEAVKIYDEAIKYPECQAEGCYYRSLAYEALGESEKAGIDLREAARLGYDRAKTKLQQP